MKKKTPKDKKGSEDANKVANPQLAKELARIDVEDEINIQSDRGAAIIASSLVEDSLKTYLKSHLLITKNGKGQDTDSLFHFDGGLGTFGTATCLSYAMRLISEEIFLDLNLIRKIRNEFAHWPKAEIDAPHDRELLTFQKRGLRDRCLCLRYPERHPPLASARIYSQMTSGKISGDEFSAALSSDECDPPPTDPRERFVYTCKGLAKMFSRSPSAKMPEVQLKYSQNDNLPSNKQ